MSTRISKGPVRVLVIDSSAKGAAAIRKALAHDPAIEVVGWAPDGETTVANASAVHAGVIVVGHRPASTDALVAIRHVMHFKPLPVVVVSPVAASGQGTLAFDLLQAGALSVVVEPWSLPHDEAAAATAQLVQTVTLMSEVKVVRRWRVPVPPAAYPALPVEPARRPPRRQVALVAIGASTGGPVALKSILARLPGTFPVPIVMVQHISAGFVDGLARWLSADSAIPVITAVTGAPLKRGHAYMAPDGAHMRIAANGTVALDLEAPVNGHRPAVSCLFRSVAERYGPNAVGILLTGMGKDGAAELKMMKDAGAITIAQDEATSVVHGMPGEAIRCQAATHVMSLDEIATTLPLLATK